MKQLDLDIITADKTITFKVDEPETDQEVYIGLSNLDHLPEKHGMIYFSLYKNNPCGVTYNATANFPLDFLFLDSCGNIKKISKNISASSEVDKPVNTFSVLELNAGDCDKYGIEVGDSVVHEKMNILPGNKIMFHVLFDKITERTLYRINPKDIVFFAFAEGGAMGWAGTYQVITKTKNDVGFFFIHHTGISSTKVIDDMFPPIRKAAYGFTRDSIDDPNWSVANMGFGNHLFIRKDVSDEFFEKLKDHLNKPAGIYQNWVGTAKELLVDKGV